MKKVTTWILVADGSRARVLLNEGPGRGVERTPVHEFDGPHMENREIMADRPGRAFDSAGQGRHAMERPTDPKEHEQHEFHRAVAGFLDKGFDDRRFDRLVVIAPPKALGSIRSLLSDRVQGKVTAELNKDLTKVPAHDIASHLGDVMAV